MKSNIILCIFFGLFLQETHGLYAGQKRKAEEISSESESPDILQQAHEYSFMYFEPLVKSSKTLPELEANIKNFALTHSDWAEVSLSDYGKKMVKTQKKLILQDIQNKIVSFCRKAPAHACTPIPDVTQIGIDGIVSNDFADPVMVWVIRNTKKEYNNQNEGYDLLKTLLDNGAAVDESNNKGDTPLILAAFNGKTGMVDMLLDADASVNLRNNFDTTPLMVASEKGQKFIVDALLKHGADTSRVNHRNETALDIAQRKYKETESFVYNQIITMLTPKKKKKY